MMFNIMHSQFRQILFRFGKEYSKEDDKYRYIKWVFGFPYDISYTVGPVEVRCNGVNVVRCKQLINAGICFIDFCMGDGVVKHEVVNDIEDIVITYAEYRS